MNETIGFLLLLLAKTATKYAGSLVNFLIAELNSFEVEEVIYKLLRLLM